MFGKWVLIGLPLMVATLAAPAQSEILRFDKPTVDGVLLDWCRLYADKCGQPAADAFCRANGYRRTVRYVKWNGPGLPTKIISNGQICDDPGCDSFVWIECKK